MQEELITIKRVTYLPEADIFKTILETNGIECFIFDSTSISCFPFYSNALGGVRIIVKKNEVVNAMEFLNLKFEEISGFEEITGIPNLNLPILKVCPNCSSDNIYFHKKPTKIFILTLLFFKIPIPPFYKKIYYCFDCANKW